jgi:hypothetical protein
MPIACRGEDAAGLRRMPAASGDGAQILSASPARRPGLCSDRLRSHLTVESPVKEQILDVVEVRGE